MSEVLRVEFDECQRMIDRITTDEIEIAEIVKKDKVAAIYLKQEDDCVMFKPEKLQEIIKQLQSIKD